MYEIEISKPISLPSIPVDLYFFPGRPWPGKIMCSPGSPEVWARNFPKISQIVLFFGYFYDKYMNQQSAFR